MLTFLSCTKVLDRTNWKLGKLDINILVLSIKSHGVGIRILWSMLNNKGGNSKTEERKELIDRFIKIFGADSIESLLADREFIGDNWLKYLDNKGINFYIRIKSNLTIGRSEMSNIMKSVPVNCTKSAPEEIKKICHNILRFIVSPPECIILSKNRFNIKFRLKFYKN